MAAAKATAMIRFIAETTSDGVTERLFTVGEVPGAVWAPAGGAASARDARPRPLVLLGHGGSQHKTSPEVAERARRLAGSGFAVAAIDMPGWGGRPFPARCEPITAQIRELTAAGKPPDDAVARLVTAVAAHAVPEWRAVIDALTGLDGIGGPVGYWGLSLGCATGVPLVAAEPRIRAAVLGLMGHQTLLEAAALITVPVRFLLQWDDEIAPRDRGLALFGAIGSADKTLHANPGSHSDMPAFEEEAAELFLTRHLTG